MALFDNRSHTENQLSEIDEAMRLETVVRQLRRQVEEAERLAALHRLRGSR